MALSKANQKILFELLLEQLEPTHLPPLTLRELKRRAADLKSGRVKGLSPEEMFSRAKRLL